MSLHFARSGLRYAAVCNAFALTITAQKPNPCRLLHMGIQPDSITLHEDAASKGLRLRIHTRAESGQALFHLVRGPSYWQGFGDGPVLTSTSTAVILATPPLDVTTMVFR